MHAQSEAVRPPKRKRDLAAEEARVVKVEQPEEPARESGGGAAAAAGAINSSSPPQRKRIRNFTANDRAAHRVFEKSRREAFKSRLIELANLLPSLIATDSRRLSKHVVVGESIARHKLLYSRCEAAIRGIRSLLDERDSLLGEVNQQRAEAGMHMREPLVGVEAFEAIFEAERDVFLSKNQEEDCTRAESQRASSSGLMDDGDSHVSAGTGSGEDMGMMSLQRSQSQPQQQRPRLLRGGLDPGLVADGSDLGTPASGPAVPVSVPAPAAQAAGVMAYSHARPAALPQTTMPDNTARAAALHHRDTTMDMAPHMFPGFDLGAIPQHQHHHHHHQQHRRLLQQQQQPSPLPPLPPQQQHRHYIHHAAAAAAANTGRIRHHHGGAVSPIQSMGGYNPPGHERVQGGHPHQGSLQHAAASGQPPMLERTTQPQYMDQLAAMPYLGSMW